MLRQSRISFFAVTFIIMLFSAAVPLMADAAAGQGPDYAQKKCWVRLDSNADKSFDVFFVHPTTYMDLKDGYNASLDNAEVNKSTEKTVERQASVFEETCNIFAPRYRQASIAVLKLDGQTRDKYLKNGMKDVRAALEYYLKHYNNGRPFILASHSQGSSVLLMLLLNHRGMIDDRKLIAAYMIGWTITEKDLKQLKLPLAEKADQTCVVITWNTIGDGGKSPTLLPGALCVNPLSWTTDRKDQPKTLNIYAKVLLKDGKKVKIPHFTSAQIGANGGLVIPVPSIIDEINMGMGPAVYHAYDYDFFYGNLAENAAVRCRAWQKLNQASAKSAK